MGSHDSHPIENEKSVLLSIQSAGIKHRVFSIKLLMHHLNLYIDFLLVFDFHQQIQSSLLSPLDAL